MHSIAESYKNLTPLLFHLPTFKIIKVFVCIHVSFPAAALSHFLFLGFFFFNYGVYFHFYKYFQAGHLRGMYLYQHKFFFFPPALFKSSLLIVTICSKSK